MPTVPPKSNRRNRRRTGRAEYEAMLESHRAHLGGHKRAATSAGVSYNTARKAFREGLGPGMPAIEKVIHREMTEARATLAQQRTRDATEIGAVEQLASEGVPRRVADGRVLRLASQNTTAALGICGRILGQALRLSTRFHSLVEDPDWEPTPKEMAALFRAIARVAHTSSRMDADVHRMEELVLGDPAIVAEAATEMTVDEAVEALLAGERTLARIRRRAAATG